jgi:Circadian oscillating protein COP23
MRLLAKKIIHTAGLGTYLVILAHFSSCASTQIDSQRMPGKSPDERNNGYSNPNLPVILEPGYQSMTPTPQIYSQQSPQFYCFPDSTGNHFTRVSITNGKSLNLIHWKDTPKPRLVCDQVSRKFQDFYNAGKLNYIKGGISKKTGNSIICGTAEDIECNEKSKLFELPPYTNSANSLADDLKQRLRGNDDIGLNNRPRCNNCSVIYQELVIDFQEILAELRTPNK